MEAPVKSGADERALTKHTSDFQKFSSGLSQESENFSPNFEESLGNFPAEGFENFCSETPTDFENLSDEKLDAWLQIEEAHSQCCTLHEVDAGSVPEALLSIASKFASSRFDLTAAVLDAILLHVTYAFRAHGTITVGLRAESLAKSLGKSIRSIQEVLQDLDEHDDRTKSWHRLLSRG